MLNLVNLDYDIYTSYTIAASLVRVLLMVFLPY